MSDWHFQYTNMINTLDVFAVQTQDKVFQETWIYTKKMIESHAIAICPSDIPKEEALSIAWSQFEATFDEDEENALLSLAGIIANFINAIPYGLSTSFYHTIEIAFARARGFSQEEAELQKSERQRVNPDWNTFVAESDGFDDVPKEEAFSALRLIEGGLGST
jgi:hypothetical protein